MTNPSLTLVQTFYQLAKLGSFSAAARELNLSYQSVANQIRKLEQVLGHRLIVSEQGAKRISLTTKGVSLYNVLNPEMDVMLERVKKLIDIQSHTLRIGVSQGFFVHVFPGIIQRFRLDYPHIQLAFYERDTSLPDLVRNGDIEVMISERYFGDPVLSQRLLGTYRLSLVCPAAWGPPPAGPALVRWLHGRPFVTHEPGQTLRNMAADFLTQNGLPSVPVISASSSVSVKRCIEAGFGFGILPGWSVQPGDQAVTSLQLSDVPSVQVHFGVARFLQENLAVRSLYAICQEELGAILTLTAGASPGSTTTDALT